MKLQKIGVLGAGTMGAGIAQVAAQAGFAVLLVDVDEGLVERGLKVIAKSLEKAIERGKIPAEVKESTLGKINCGVGLNILQDVDVVIEAIVENIDIKKKVYAELDRICPAHTILASNTSSLSITELGAVTKRPEKVVGMHFFNPVPVMRLVEVIPGRVSSGESLEIITGISRQMDKVPINTKESPGFIVNRILVPMINEAVMAYQEGIGTAEEIDTAMKLGANMQMGPLALADLVGIDVVLAVMEVFYKEFSDSKYRPALLLKQMLRAGHLGVKSGKGFYDYSNR